MKEEYPKIFNGIEVVRGEDKPGVNATYYKGTIILRDNWFKLDKVRQESILLHEYAHHLFFKLPKIHRTVWRFISNGRLIRLLSDFGVIGYKENTYYNSNSKKTYLEDFSEMIELHHLREEKHRLGKKRLDECTKFKLKVAVSLFNNYK